MAILDGRKTQIRRVILSHTGNCPKLYPITKIFSEPLGAMYVGGIIRPRYQPGDVMYARETWAFVDCCESGYVHKASDNGQEWANNSDDWKWEPSCRMPREAARLYLRVTGVRAERLQDISRADAIAEGFCNEDDWGAEVYFEDAWNEQNKKNGRGWETNPWIWVTSFERCETENEKN